jgi:hypothetical protein
MRHQAIIAADTARYTMALAAVPSSEARPTFFRGFFTRLAVMADFNASEGDRKITAPWQHPPERASYLHRWIED